MGWDALSPTLMTRNEGCPHETLAGVQESSKATFPPWEVKAALEKTGAGLELAQELRASD